MYFVRIFLMLMRLAWYVVNGDPRWDDDKLWTTMGHLYKGGMWFRNKDYIG